MRSIQLLSILTLIGLSAQAATIAVIDSGTDLSHNDLKSKKWVNPIDVDDAVDNDDNGFIDDLNGWNFAENNNKLVDMSYVGTFSQDVYKFFEVQTRILKGEATDADREWMKQAKQNEELIAELGTFGNFVHGTHVAAITAKNAEHARLMPLKIIPTKRPGTFRLHQFGGIINDLSATMGFNDNMEMLIKMGLKALASQQAKALEPIGTYVGKEKARIANCSFGTSVEAVKTILPQLLKLVLRREPTEEELNKYANYFVSEIVVASEALVSPAVDTLFVVAAGNDGTNNDTLPVSPANVKMQNTISVAATFGYDKIASFSNYGATMVEVAAPGVGIESAIPGNQYLTVSGTSQAAPFVANAAGLLVDTNPNLSNSDLKKILIETSDLKDFMKGKVVAGGIVNTGRAITAAKLALSMQLSAAIAAARAQVNDIHSFTREAREESFVLPLPSLF